MMIPVIDTMIPLIDMMIPLFDTMIPLIDTMIPVIDTMIPLIDMMIPLVDTMIPLIDTMIPLKRKKKRFLFMSEKFFKEETPRGLLFRMFRFQEEGEKGEGDENINIYVCIYDICVNVYKYTCTYTDVCVW